MHPFLQNKFVRVGLIGAGILAVIFIALIFLASMNNARSLGLSDSMMGYAPSAPAFGTSENRTDSAMEKMVVEADSIYYPQPTPDGYTSGLESYETTAYSVSGRVKDFDPFCNELTNLKADTNVHFKYLNESTNNCRATFYVKEDKVEQALNSLTSYKGVEFIRNTESVTLHRQQIQNQTSIIQQQLSSVSRSLTAAETQFDELADFARASKDAAALSEAIRYKLQNVDNLTNRKINLNSQLSSLYQQAADLEERIGVVQFDVNITRANPIYVGKYERQWEAAWSELQDQFNDTLIGLSAFFGIFLLWVIRMAIYLLVLIVITRGLWKFGRLLWTKW